ncbi:MAG: type II secretion system GspH family protein [Candidatus Omnitrophica bacterium]|nr:type II secretion system GspH family protein [Candidatus Omnitrophota bacterium]
MKKGFTLIELMIVMAVIAILIGIALPRIKGMQDEAKITQAKGETNTLKIAIESYCIHHSDTYPASSTTIYSSYLDANSVSPGPQIIGARLFDPFAPTTDYYYIRGTGATGINYYAVCSKGPDGAVDVTAAEINNGELTIAEKDDDICGTNCSQP